MKWMNKDISSLLDTELLLAYHRTKEMKELHDDRISKRRDRHKNIEFGVNPTFTALQNEIKEEITKRGIEL